MIPKLALAAFLFLCSGSAANAIAVCQLSTTGVNFGEIQFAKTNLTATGAIVITCVGNEDVDYVLSLSPGVNNQYSPRKMPMVGSSSISLPYNLYSETSLLSIWGNGTSGTVLVSGRIRLGGNNLVAIVPHAIYGRIENLAAPAAGDYADIVIATLAASNISTVTVPLQITAHVANHCTISATNLNFPDYDDPQVDGQSEIELICTQDTAWDVGLNGGRFPGALVSRRTMAGPGLAQLDYQLYTDPARTNVWGDRIGNDTVSGTGTGLPQTLNVYGRIPAGQNANDGGYADTITATVTF